MRLGIRGDHVLGLQVLHEGPHDVRLEHLVHKVVLLVLLQRRRVLVDRGVYFVVVVQRPHLLHGGDGEQLRLVHRQQLLWGIISQVVGDGAFLVVRSHESVQVGGVLAEEGLGDLLDFLGQVLGLRGQSGGLGGEHGGCLGTRRDKLHTVRRWRGGEGGRGSCRRGRRSVPGRSQ